MARTAVSDHPADRRPRRHPAPTVTTAPAALPRPGTSTHDASTHAVPRPTGGTR
jgi:hypothetical protein